MRILSWLGVISALLSFGLFGYTKVHGQTHAEFASATINQAIAHNLPLSTGAMSHTFERKLPPELTADNVATWLDGYMPYALADGDIVGAVVTVVKDGNVLVNRGYGFADLAQREPVDPETTLFRPGSISKLFTATAVMQLVEQGELDLDQNINTYLDFELPMPLGEITLRHLLTHTPGFEEVLVSLLFADPDATDSLHTYLTTNIPSQIFPPGEVPAYSNYANALAGYIVERVSGEPFEDYIEQHIFVPLGMEQSTFRQPLPATLEPHISQGYWSRTDGQPQPFEMIADAPAGALSASGSDMARFMIAHLNDGEGLLQPETARLMHETLDTHFPPLNGMTLGFYQQDQNGLRIIGHGGDIAVFHSDLFLLMDENIGVYISMNSGGIGGANALIREHLQKAFVDRYFPVAAPVPVPLPTAYEHGQAMAGTYEFSRRSVTNPFAAPMILSQTYVSVGIDGELYVTSEPQKTWQEVEPWVWQAKGGTERLVARVVDGQVQAFAVEPSSSTMIATPVPWWRSSAWLILAFGGAVLVFAMSIVAWLVRAFARWRFGVPFPLKGARAIAYRMAPIASCITLAYMLGWGTYFSWAVSSVTDLAETSRVWLQVLYGAGALPFVSAGMLGWVNLIVWREDTGWFTRVSAAILLVAVIVTIWFAAVGGLFSFDLTY
ncbi:MAG: serine hydrolase domain-containing protein [Chloroflexota bacterium]